MRWFSILASLLAVPFLASCGSDDSDDGGSSGPSSSCTVTITGDVTHEGPCEIFFCTADDGGDFLDLSANWGDADMNVCDFYAGAPADPTFAFAPGTYHEADLPVGYMLVLRSDGLELRNGTSDVTITLDSLTPSTDPNDTCAGRVVGTVSGDAQEINATGTPKQAHFEYVMK